MMVRIVLAASVLLLSACGGGGSGVDVDTGLSARIDWQRDRAAVLAASGAQIFDAVAAAALAQSRFGSVTQSSNRGGDGLTADNARIAFDGQHPTLTVTRGDGRRDRLATSGDFDPIAEFRQSRIRDHASGGWSSLLVGEDSISVSRFVVSWNRRDPADYLAGAYWLRLSGLGDPEGFRFDHVEMGAAVDGPGLTTESPLSATHLASYTGPVRGYFAIEEGAAAGDDPNSARGSVELGSFSASIDLYANFRGQDPFIHGCIACGSPMRFHSLEADEDSGSASALEDSYRDYAIDLDLTPIAPDGSFHGTGVRVSMYGAGIEETAGSWGGMLSSVNDYDGNPRAAAGTFGATFTAAGQRRGAFAGMFMGWERPSRLVIE